MKLILSPQRSDQRIVYKVEGENLIINDEVFDLSGDWQDLTAGLEGERYDPKGNLLSGIKDSKTGEITLKVRATYAKNSPLYDEEIILEEGESIKFPHVKLNHQ